jgi:hypothetical protein
MTLVAIRLQQGTRPEVRHDFDVPIEIGDRIRENGAEQRIGPALCIKDAHESIDRGFNPRLAGFVFNLGEIELHFLLP